METGKFGTSPGVGQVAVPDRAAVVRRHSVGYSRF